MDNTLDMALDIAQLGPGELPIVERLARQIWPRCYAEISSPEQIEYMLGWMYSLEQLRQDHEQGVSFLQLRRNGEAIGFAAWGPWPKEGGATTCKLHKLYLLPEYHGRGLGSKLLAAVMDQARQRGFSRMILNVNKKNAAAITAYLRHGFTVREACCNDIGQGFVMDDFVMQAPLERRSAAAAPSGMGVPPMNRPVVAIVAPDSLADALVARRDADVSLANFADLLDRLSWMLQNGEDEIETARARWLAGDEEEKVELALLMDERFPYETKEEMDREFARITGRWPRLATLCRRILRQWEEQGEE